MNPNAKHTPGPWMQGPTANTWHKVYEGKKGEYGGRAICTLHNIHANGARQRGDFETETANARMVAAAPDLLYALKEAKLMLETAKAYFPKSITNRDRFSLLNVLANAVDPAIAKAEGGAK